MEKVVQIGLPILIAKEGKWFVASCPVLDIGTQGVTEKEAKKNMQHLIKEYFEDPDTPKPDIKSLFSLSISNIPVELPVGGLHGGGKASTLRSA